MQAGESSDGAWKVKSEVSFLVPMFGVVGQSKCTRLDDDR